MNVNVNEGKGNEFYGCFSVDEGNGNEFCHLWMLSVAMSFAMKKEQRKSFVINSVDALMELMQGLRKWPSLFVGFGPPLGEIMSSSLTSNPLSSSNSSTAKTSQIKYCVFRLSRRGNVKPSASPRKRELDG